MNYLSEGKVDPLCTNLASSRISNDPYSLFIQRVLCSNSCISISNIFSIPEEKQMIRVSGRRQITKRSTGSPDIEIIKS